MSFFNKLNNDNLKLVFIVWLSTFISYLVMFAIGSFYFLRVELKMIVIIGIGVFFAIIFLILNFFNPNKIDRKIVYIVVLVISLWNMINLIADGIRTMPKEEFLLVTSGNIEKLKEVDINKKINILSPYKNETLLIRSILVENESISTFLLKYSPDLSIKDTSDKTAYDYCLNSSSEFKSKFNCTDVKP